MGPGETPEYRVGQRAAVLQEVRALGERAAAVGIRDSFLAALQAMMTSLQAEPLTWGDPLYHAKKEGSVVCHAVAGPLIVRYVVYKAEREVVILNITPMKPLQA